MVDVIERVDTVASITYLTFEMNKIYSAYYANPPQIPSKQTNPNTSQMLTASMASPREPSPGPKIPFADSNINNNRMTD